jgi:hypothetical protein
VWKVRRRKKKLICSLFRIIEVDVVDNRSSTEPEVTHKNTRVKPIPLREVLEAIQDYAFVTSE